MLRLSPNINEEIAKVQKQNASGVEDGHKYRVISECDISCDENNQVKVTLGVKQFSQATVIVSTLSGMLLRRKLGSVSPRCKTKSWSIAQVSLSVNIP